MKSLCVALLAAVVIQQLLVSFADAKFNPEMMASKCCKVEESPAAKEHGEKAMKLMKECHDEIGDPAEGEPKWSKFPCMAECVTKKRNLLNEDKTINEEAFKQYIVNEMATEDYQKAVAETIATKCAEAAKQADALPEVAGASKCSKSSMIGIKCAMSGMMEACPAEMQSQDEPCVKMREMVKKDFKPPV